MRSERFRVEGRVQGVSFRAGTYALALRCGVQGFVLNVGDGSVEGRVTGPDDAVAAFLDGLWTASSRARVDVVRHAPAAPFETRGVFAVRPDEDGPTDDWSDATPSGA